MNLWRRVAATVKARSAAPFDSSGPRPPPAKPPRAQKAAPVARDASHKAPPVDRGGEKRVRRGKLDVGGTLDLHGHNQATGRAALARFVNAASARGERTIVVVTGIGRAGEGVLKQRLPEWLAEPDLRALVSGYAQAHRAHGGGGAFYVFLKRTRG